MGAEGDPIKETSRPDMVTVARWPTELPLLIVLALAAAGVWLLLVVSILGIIYGLLIGIFFFLAHVGFIAHVRGSAVRLGPEQFPELYERVSALSKRAGLTQPPEAYLMQQGGALNALATRFLRSDLMVLYSDLLDACADDASARDMIIGHEIGHIKAGHLRWIWLLMPGMLIPFLGAAYSRAREYTCDRYGAALCGDPEGAARGLAILAAGGTHAKDVNLPVFVAQRSSLDTGWMTLATWLAGYPPLSARIAAIQPDLAPSPFIPQRGIVRAVLILAAIFVAPVAGGMLILGALSATFQEALERAGDIDDWEEYDDGSEGEYGEGRLEMSPEEVGRAANQVLSDTTELAQVIQDFERRNGFAIEDLDVAASAWRAVYPDREPPLDPFDGLSYGYRRSETGFVLFSVGPDGVAETGDDMEFAFDGGLERGR